MRRPVFLFVLVSLPLMVAAFSPLSIQVQTRRQTSVAPWNQIFMPHVSRRDQPRQMTSRSSEDEETTPWQPGLRRVVTGMASLGVLETAYLTYTKLTTGTDILCGTDGSCMDVLTGPYSVIPYTDIPLASVGLAAYSLVALLAFLPLTSSSPDSDDTENRIWLTATTTAMGTFSTFLMSLLLFVLHEPCPYCIFSACLSIGMAGITWVGGALPDEERKRGMLRSAGSFVTTILASLVLFFSVEVSNFETQFAGSPGGAADSRLLASSEGREQPSEGLKPPPITTTSSERAMSLSSELQALDARMFGAYWCSHCYEQKQAFGNPAYQRISYIECSKDGYNQQTAFCKKKDVPGYPTWEIQGKLYPGEQALEELEEIVQSAKKSAK